MRQSVISVAKKLIPERCHPRVRSLADGSSITYRRLKYFGFSFHCPFCRGWYRTFLPRGLRNAVLTDKNVIGAGFRPNATCPACLSYDRERLLYLYLRTETAVFRDRVRLLHIAPERNLGALLRRTPSVDYLSGDLDPTRAMVGLDITRIGYPDETFDAIICNHVLEHVPAERMAMSELFRVLKPGGWAILQVPFSAVLEKTYEDPTIRTSEERERAYGQSDHVRLYGLDYPERLGSVGFSVNVLDPAGRLSEAVVRRYALLREEKLFIATRPKR